MLDTELGGACDGEVVRIEGDQLGVVVDAEGRDDAIQGTGVESCGAALLTEAGGIAPLGDSWIDLLPVPSTRQAIKSTDAAEREGPS